MYHKIEKDSKFNEYLQKFDEGSLANLKFSEDSNFSDNTADYNHNAMAITVPPLDSNLINIVFNTDTELSSNILTNPDVFKVVALMHEVLHAEMFRKMLDAIKHAELQHTTLKWTSWTRSEFMRFIESLANKYEGILDYFVRFEWQVPTNQEPTDWQHQQMAQHYRDVIKQALTDYDPSLTEDQKEALSWIGLNTADIVAWQLLSPEEKTRIKNMQLQIKNTFPNGCK